MKQEISWSAGLIQEVAIAPALLVH